VAVVVEPLWVPAVALFPLVILLFPDGRLASRRWRWVLWAYAGLVACVMTLIFAQTIAAVADHDGRLDSIGVGILKFRLYEIDRIISRTLAYAIVTGLLVGIYAGLVLLATGVLSLSSPIAVAVSTLAAALFSPLRRRVQRVVDRRFNRARYDADQTLAAFAAQLKDAVDLDAVRDDLASVVRQALEPAHVSVWISQRD